MKRNETKYQKILKANLILEKRFLNKRLLSEGTLELNSKPISIDTLKNCCLPDKPEEKKEFIDTIIKKVETKIPEIKKMEFKEPHELLTFVQNNDHHIGFGIKKNINPLWGHSESNPGIELELTIDNFKIEFNPSLVKLDLHTHILHKPIEFFAQYGIPHFESGGDSHGHNSKNQNQLTAGIKFNLGDKKNGHH
jgi:hypothetical protein